MLSASEVQTTQNYDFDLAFLDTVGLKIDTMWSQLEIGVKSRVTLEPSPASRGHSQQAEFQSHIHKSCQERALLFSRSTVRG